MDGIITKADLNIFRGTYKECMAKETENMTIYLAWDTGEIFVGNAKGAKVKYGGNKNIKDAMEPYFEEFRETIYDNINSYANTAIDRELDNIYALLDQKYSTQLAALRDEVYTDIVSRVNSLNENIIEANSDVSALRNRVQSVESSIETVSRSLTAVDGEYSELYGRVSAAETEIESIKDALASLNLLPTYTIEDAGKVLAVGEDGRLEWVEATIGGSGSKLTIDAGLTLNLRPDSGNINYGATAEFEVCAENITLILEGSVENPIAVKSLAIGGLIWNPPYTREITFSGTSVGTRTYTVTGTPADETRTTRYTVTSQMVTIKVYQPILFGNLSNLTKFKPGVTRLTSQITAGEEVYILSDHVITSVTSSGFAVPFTSEGRQVSPVSVNGVNDVYYYVYSLGRINDTTIEIDIN